MNLHTNRLAGESSPYLLQHAHNPVDWYPWGDEALAKARAEDKPILVSIGYAACHWCHVMERESFEDEHIAAIMNASYVNIKIDREERPDLDHIYMDALQILEGHGGWPLNMFLTPEGKPFYGGTYFPPRPVHNRPSWEQVLMGVDNAWKERRQDIEQQAEQLLEHLHRSNGLGMSEARSFEIPVHERFTRQHAKMIADNLLKPADRDWGGFGGAPKFPQSFSIRYLLEYHRHSGDKDALQHALHSLDAMIRGGIHDHIGGGFARYSTDRQWLAPHFEKMAYDNALLVLALCDAWQVTGLVKYQDIIHRTLGFVERELLSPEGGFWSALDADSEGVEGKYYTWTLSEVRALLGEESGLFEKVYDITETGNWEGVNIPRLLHDIPEGMEGRLALSREVLLKHRSGRIRPLLDDKVLLGWNALLNQAFSRAYAVTGEERYLGIARRNMDFLMSAFRDGASFHHTWKGEGRYPAFLDDKAALVAALVSLQEVTGDLSLLRLAGEITEGVIRDHGESGGPFFFYTPSQQADVILRKKEVYDGAVPSGNAMMAKNLHVLGILLDRSDWRASAAEMVDRLHEAITRHPSSFGVWASLLQELAVGTLELVVTGPGAVGHGREVLRSYLPNRVMLATEGEGGDFTLLEGRVGKDSGRFWLCRDNRCLKPVDNLVEFTQLIELEY